MPIKGAALTVPYIAWDTVNNAGKTGDVANHTLRGVGDGTEYTPAASPAEVDATNFPGAYKVAIAAGENNYDVVTLGGKSSTTGISLIPITWLNSPPTAVRKNVALSAFEFPMVLADHATAATGKTISAYRSIDGAAFGVCANAVTEIVDATRPGWYKIDLAAADLNGTVIALNFAEATCDTTQVVIVTQP